MTLHIISQNNPQVAANCLAALNPADCIVCINDGVYLLATHQLLQAHPSCYALEDDTLCRGLQLEHTISYKEFVKLSCLHSPSQSWF